MKDTTISARQAGMLCAVLVLANKIFLLPSLIYEGAKSDGFFVALMLFIVDLFVLTTFFMLKAKYPDNTLDYILEKHIGKIFSKIIYIILMIFFLFKVLLTYSVVYAYLKGQVYQDEFALLALISVIPVVNHAVVTGLRSFSRTIELYFYAISAGVLICLAVALVNNQGMPYFFNTSVPEFFNSAFKHIFTFGDYIFLFLIIDKIKMEKKEGKEILKFAGIGIFFVLSIFFLFYSIYQITAFMHNNALTDILSASNQSNSVGRLDVIAMLTIMFLSYFQLSIFAFGFSEAFCNVFHKLNRAYSVAVFDVIFIIVYVILVGRYENMLLYTRSWLPYLALVTNYLIPLMIFFMALPKKKGVKYEKNY